MINGHNERIVDQTMPMTVDMNNKPLKAGDAVCMYGLIDSIDEDGQVVVKIDTSDGKHFYTADTHCHCCEKQ